MSGLPRKSTKNQFTKLLKKSGKSKTNTESGATAVTKNISTKENKILKYQQFINENMKSYKKGQSIKIDTDELEKEQHKNFMIQYNSLPKDME